MGNTKMKKVWERRVVDIDDVRGRETRLRLHLTGLKAQAAHPSTVHLQSMPTPWHGRKSVISRTIAMIPIVLEIVRMVGRGGVDKPKISIVGIPGNPADSFRQVSGVGTDKVRGSSAPRTDERSGRLVAEKKMEIFERKWPRHRSLQV